MKLMFAFLFISIYNLPFGQQEIVWKEGVQLTWEDFKGPKRDSRLAAETYCSINTGVAITGNRLSVSVHAVFYSDSSWYNPEKVNALTLQHEQGHFHLAELYARKLRKFVREKILTFTDYQNHFEAYYEEIHKEYFERQEQYDEETVHGTIRSMQQAWIEIMEMELVELKEYEE